MWRYEAGTRVLQPLPGSTNGQNGSSWAPTAARWRERRREAIPWCTARNSPPLGTQRLRKLLLVKFWVPLASGPMAEQEQNILHPALLRGRERCGHHLPMSSLLTLWVACLRASSTCACPRTPKWLHHRGWWGGRSYRFVSSSERCLPRSCERLMHFREEWHQRGALRTSATPTGKPLVQAWRIRMRWRIPHEPDILSGLGNHSHHLWVWLGQRYHTRSGQRNRVVIPGERGLALQCSVRHLVVRGGTEGNAWCTPSSRGPSALLRQLHRLQSAWGVRSSTWGSP